MVLAVLLTGVFVASCAPAPGGGSGGEPLEGKYIIGDIHGDWGYPTPFAAYPRGPGYVRMSFVFDTLVWKDEDGFTGALAEEWSFEEEKMRYTFQLREGVKWHDGVPFSAADVVFTFRYLQEQPFHWADLSGIEEIEKQDENVVRITLKAPDACFENNVAGVVPILPRHIWEGVEEPEDFTGPEAVVGTGPFRLEEYRREQGLYRFSAFEDYYLGEPRVDHLLITKVSDPQQALLRGDVQYAQVQPEAVSSMEDEGFEVARGAHDWALKLMFNHREPPFDRAEFRQALALGLNLEVLVERALRGHGLPGSPGLVSPDSRWYCDDLPDYSHDPEKAAEILTELGYTLDEGGRLVDEEGKQVSIGLTALSDYAREAEIIGDQLRNLGLDVEVRSAERSLVDTQIRNWNFEMAVTGHGGMGGDPEILKRFMVGEVSPHLNARSENPALIEKLDAQRRELDTEKRAQMVCSIQRIYAEELPAFTLHYPSWYFVYTDDVEWFFTRDGIGSGTPLPLNKMALVD